MSEDKLRDAEVTLSTVRAHVTSTLASPLPSSGQARGYWHAMHDILAILDSHGLPEGDPVIFKELPD